MIRAHGGIFGRNPSFNEVEIQGGLTVNGGTGTFGVDTDLTVPVILYKSPSDNPTPFIDITNNVPLTISTPQTPDFPSIGSSGLPGNVMIQVFDSTASATTFAVADNGDIQCNNISMGGYLSPADLYVSGKGWFNAAPNDTLANGPYLWLTIPSSGDAGDWFVITDEFGTPYVAVNESGYATFSAGATISSLIVNNTNTINGVQQGKVSVTTTSTAQNNSLRWPSTYTSVRFWIQGRNTTSGRFQITELVATRNGATTVVIATPVNTNTGGVAATYSVDINSGNWRLLITPSLATSTTFTVFYTVM